jgi:uncharacterized protein YaiE (UPF0345 family)
MVLGASLMASEAAYAMPVYRVSSVNPTFSNEKIVTFKLKNDTAAAITVKAAGGSELTLAPGQTEKMKLASGTQVVATADSSHYAAGSVITVVSNVLQDSTVTMR